MPMPMPLPTTLLLDDDMRGRLENYYAMLTSVPDAGAALDAVEYAMQVLHLHLVIDHTALSGWALVPLERPTRPHYQPTDAVPQQP